MISGILRLLRMGDKVDGFIVMYYNCFTLSHRAVNVYSSNFQTCYLSAEYPALFAAKEAEKTNRSRE